VVAVADPEAALSQRGHFDLAIVDLCLPEMSGDALLARLRSAGLVQKALLVTGMEPPEPKGGGADPDGVLRKPFELEDLFEHIARLCPNNSRRSSATG
jgi:CheY-like chemotaxis protein